MPDCDNCNEKCPQAEMAHEIALGRMYATKELIKLVKKIESGQLVEVVRCRDCIAHNLCKFEQSQGLNGFCSYGERKCNGKRKTTN